MAIPNMVVPSALPPLHTSQMEISTPWGIYSSCTRYMTSVEVKAWKLVCERMGERVKEGKKVGKNKWERVCVERDPRVVCDVLSMKIEYCREEEEEARTKYRRYKSKLDQRLRVRQIRGS